MGWLLILVILVLVADIVGIKLLVDTAQEKGFYRDNASVLWFVGLCGTLFMLGQVVGALPDRGESRAAEKNTQDALPEL